MRHVADFVSLGCSNFFFTATSTDVHVYNVLPSASAVTRKRRVLSDGSEGYGDTGDTGSRKEAK